VIRWTANGTGGLKFLRQTRPIRRRRWALGSATAALALACAASLGCYEAKPLRLTVVTPATALDCARTADQVFFDAAYVRVVDVYGPDLFYTPRVSVPAATTARRTAGLGWGIGVWLKPAESGGHACSFELESLSSDPGPSLQRTFSAQRGDDFDRTLKEMAERLTVAFEPPAPPPG
jgi:hypothetical protein